MAASSLGFLFALYSTEWMLEKPATWKQTQTKKNATGKPLSLAKGSQNGYPSKKKTFDSNHSIPDKHHGKNCDPIPIRKGCGEPRLPPMYSCKKTSPHPPAGMVLVEAD